MGGSGVAESMIKCSCDIKLLPLCLCALPPPYPTTHTQQDVEDREPFKSTKASQSQLFGIDEMVVLCCCATDAAPTWTLLLSCTCLCVP